MLWKDLRHLIDQGLRSDALVGRGLGHFLAVLVHADEEPDVVPLQPVISRDAVGADLFEGVAHVGVAVRIVDRRRDEEATHSGLSSEGTRGLRSLRHGLGGHAAAGVVVARLRPAGPGGLR